MIRVLLLFACLFPIFVSGQSIERTWNYEVLNTISGDYFGDLIIEKKADAHLARIVSRGRDYRAVFEYVQDDSISILSNVEGFVATIKGRFSGDEFNGNVIVLGDTNIYPFHAQNSKNDLPHLGG